MSTLLEVTGLDVEYRNGDDVTHAVRNVSFSLDQGEFVGLVGESGSGKSTLGFAIAGLSKPPAYIANGRVLLDGVDIASLSPAELREQRHGGVAMVLQSGMNALNPVRTIRNHFRDIFEAHGHVEKSRWDARAAELVDKVKLPATVLTRYPGELSGGMRQRISIALALSLEPKLMVFDEPTTALDVLVQHAVMETIIELQRTERFTALLISHDLGIVLESAQRVMVMHEGAIVEDGSASDILNKPSDDYTQMLLSHYADPRADVVELPGFEDRAARAGTPRSAKAVHPPSVSPREKRSDQRALVLENVSKVYPPPRRGESQVVAVDDVSFTLEPGASLALVGASGSGKSTIGKLMTAVEKPTSGSIRFGDLDVGKLRRSQFRRLHRDVQMVFQDPYAALNPLHTVEYTLTRPIINFTKQR
ncbi:MAG: ATP-binding cassette domain-containing protein, partial [Rhodoglobus sp.]|nr:ATP-binding cassette domain-containing protein [Rhodoglobus sp.]